MRAATTRKVNKPRLTLRKTVSGDRELHPMYRGIVPFLLAMGADLEKVEMKSPEELLGMFATFMNKAGAKGYGLSKEDRLSFEYYLKLYGIEDWTREAHEQGKRKASADNAGSKGSKRVERVGKSIMPVRTVVSRKGNR